MRERNIPDATVARLPLYLRALVELQERSIATVSSGDLARASGVNPAKLRKDLSHLGSFGTRGVGYPVKELVDGISGALGLTDERPVVIVGLGNLGQALAHYSGFAQRGFHVAGLFDAAPTTIGTTVAGLEVEDVADLETVIGERGVTIAVLATPAAVAQEVATRLVEAGVTAILNFAPVHLSVPDQVTIRKVDLSVELQILSFYEQLHANGGFVR